MDQKINELKNSLAALAASIAATSDTTARTALINARNNVLEQLRGLGVGTSPTDGFNRAVAKKIETAKPFADFDGYSPRIAIFMITSMATNLMRKQIWDGRRLENLVSMTARKIGDEGRHSPFAVSTGPQARNPEDELLEKQDDIESGLEAIAALWTAYKQQRERCAAEGVTLDLREDASARNGFDDFPTFEDVMRAEEARRKDKQVRFAAERDVARMVAPSAYDFIK